MGICRGASNIRRLYKNMIQAEYWRLMKSHREEILNGNIIKVLILFAVPVALNNIILRFYAIVDTWFTVQLGETAIATLTFVSPINQLILSIANGLAVAGTAMLARRIGEGNEKETKKVLQQLMVIALTSGVFMALAGIFFSSHILALLGATSDIAAAGSSYLTIVMLSAPITFVFTIFLAYKRSYGGTKEALYISLISMTIKVIFSYLFIMVMDFSLEGLAYSLMIAHGLVLVFMLVDINRSTNIELFKKIDFELILKIMIIALPVMLEKSAMSFGHIIGNGFIVEYGETALAGLGVTNRFNSIAFGATAGIGAGLGIIIAQNLGNGQVDRVKKSIRQATVFTFFISIILLGIQLLFRSMIAEIFSSGEVGLYNSIMGSMIVIGPSVIFWAQFQITIGALQGAGLTKRALLISLIRLYVFRVPILILFSQILGYGESSIWYAMLISNALTSVVAFIFLKRIKWEELAEIKG